MGFTQQAWLPFASRVGENWLPGTTGVGIDYPAQLGLLSGPFARTVDQSTEIGQKLLHAKILEELASGTPVVVAGLSEGTLVINRELAYLETVAPLPGDVTFYVFGDMQRGLGNTYLRGLTIPFVGQTFAPVPESSYDTVVVNEQWDGWALPPDRPWNPVAVVNAMIGAFITIGGFNDHTQSALDDMSTAVLMSDSVNSKGGRTTTYMIPRQQLPLTRVLRQVGIPAEFVDAIDRMLMPIIAAGYSYLTPQLGPRIEQGRLVFTPPPAPATSVVTSAAETGDAEPQRSATTGTASTTGDLDATTLPVRDAPNAGKASPDGYSPLTETVEQETVGPETVELRSVEPAPETTGTTRTEPPSVADAASSAADGPDAASEAPDRARPADKPKGTPEKADAQSGAAAGSGGAADSAAA